MPKDNRLYARIALDMADHPKVLPLSDAAFRCLIEATLWSRKHMTDGFLARRLALARWPLETLTELSTNDDDNPSLIATEQGWFIHDFALHQDTKAEIELRTKRAKDAGQRGGLAKAKQTAKQNASKSLSKNVAETETETDKELTTDVVSSTPRKRGTRLPTNWKPTPTTTHTIRSERPDLNLDAEHLKFIDHWTAKTGRDATKLDWDATWRNWMRNARSAATPNGNPPNKLRALADLAAEIRQIETNRPKEIQE